MMTKKAIWITMLLGILPAAGLAQPEPPTSQPEQVQTQKPDEPVGFLPANQLMDGLLRRWTNEVWLQFDLDQRQSEKATAEVMRQWHSFFNKNAVALGPLLTEYLQMRMRREPPDKNRIRRWAGKTTPLLVDAQNQMEHGIAEMRKIIEPHQRAKFEKLIGVLRRGLDEARARLRRMETGAFAPEDFPGLMDSFFQQHDQRREPIPAARRPVETVAANDPVAAELNAWRAYVESFIETHRLDPGQRNAAWSLLAEMSQRAGAHRDGRRSEIDGLERRIKTFDGAKVQLVELKKQLTKLYGPFDAMFLELDTRLHTILTAEQRARAAQEKTAVPKSDKQP